KRCRRIDVWTEIVQRATAASRATDPMLSRTWSLEQHESSRLVVCEHVAGTSLAQELEQHGPLPVVQAGVLVSQVARAVGELHRLGAVHGCLSPDVLRREPPPGGVPRTGRVRLLQFPLAGDPHRMPLRPWNDDAELAALGKPSAYAAPELMVAGSVCDPRSDVYSIGAILYALLSGTPPCWEGTAEATLRRAAFGAGPKPLGRPLAGAEMATLVGCLMARDPADRYQTADEAADAIAACLGLAVSAAPTAAAVAERTVAGQASPVAEKVPDFSGLNPTVRPAASARPAVGGAATPAVAAAVSPAIRRRAARVRTIGVAVTVAILLATAALVFSRIKSGSPASERTAVEPIRRPPATPPAQPPVGGVEGWGEPPPGLGVKGEPRPADGGDTASRRQRILDDPTLPWASPTEGRRPTLAYLPPGSQLVMLARPAALLADDEGRLFVRALGPEAEAGLRRLASWCGCEVADIETVQAGWQAGAGDEVLAGYAVRLGAGRVVPSDDASRRAAWGETTAVEVEGETIHQGRPFSFWVPSTEHGRVLVVAADSSADEGSGTGLATDPLAMQIARQAIAARAAEPDALKAELPRELEELAGMLDVDRHVTLFGSPHYLLTRGRMVLVGPLAKLAVPLEDLFGDAVKAAALSAHFSESSYLEVDAISSLDRPARQVATELAAKVEGLADKVERYCAALDPSPYGRVLVMRLPQMLRFVVANMRSGAEGKGAILNAHLPRHAGHNLALAAELALAQSPGTAAVADRPAPESSAAASPLGKLDQRITLVFAKDTLEKSIQMIADEIGAPMDILGPDLQLEGITKNQSFGLDARDKPAREVLLEILAKANPDGKLVYIVRQEGGVETILITTRAAVQKRNDTLPPGLEAAPTQEKKR
ncbi:MAG: hypothetical protein FJ284_12105, partial [Planctomycetes bacterium]|nr:hypothetical protein [Planctomycetota bacterium]